MSLEGHFQHYEADRGEIPSLPGTTQEAEEVFARWKGAPYVTRDPGECESLRGAFRDVCVSGIVCGLHAARQTVHTNRGGFVSVPREPTPAMLEAAKPWPKHWTDEYLGVNKPNALAAYHADQAAVESIYRTMLGAAPPPPHTNCGGLPTDAKAATNMAKALAAILVASQYHGDEPYESLEDRLQRIFKIANGESLPEPPPARVGSENAKLKDAVVLQLVDALQRFNLSCQVFDRYTRTCKCIGCTALRALDAAKGGPAECLRCGQKLVQTRPGWWEHTKPCKPGGTSDAR